MKKRLVQYRRIVSVSRTRSVIRYIILRGPSSAQSSLYTGRRRLPLPSDRAGVSYLTSTYEFPDGYEYTYLRRRRIFSRFTRLLSCLFFFFCSFMVVHPPYLDKWYPFIGIHRTYIYLFRVKPTCGVHPWWSVIQS